MGVFVYLGTLSVVWDDRDFNFERIGEGGIMKHKGTIALLLILAGGALLIGCKPAAVGGSQMAGLNCANCHSSDANSEYGLAVLQNTSEYNQGGHYNGTRVLNPFPANSYVFQGSHALSNSQTGGGACNKCHTDQGFVTAIAQGGNFYAVGNIPENNGPLPPGCFTCHNPHVTGNFIPRIVTPVNLYAGGTFNFGLGNLCANCHESRLTLAGALATTTPFSSGNGPHHGVQSDFLLGSNYWAMPGQSYTGTSPHATATADSCVSCHHYDPLARSSTTDLQLGGHGFYLTDTGGAALWNAVPAGHLAQQKDVVVLCTSCHTSASATFEGIHPTVPDWSGVYGGVATDPLVEIRALRDRLVVYFVKTASPAPLTLVGTWNEAVPLWPNTIEWNRDFAEVGRPGVNLSSLAQVQSFWNLQLFLEDRSQGIHNPVFAAQILYDACVNLSIAGLGPRPS